MNHTDNYQTIFSFLKQAENELSKAFENGTETQEDPEVEFEQIVEEKEKDDYDLEEFQEMLRQIDDEISELMARSKERESIRRQNSYNNNYSIGPTMYNYRYNSGVLNLLPETNVTDSINATNNLINCLNEEYDFHLLNDNSALNAATQTSPSLSPNSTHLTWPSDSSSSPCLTSPSDSDVLDEDTHSTTSDGREFLNGMRFPFHGISYSAPVLKNTPVQMSKHGRSQSDRHLTEIEAADACKWLRATGFPQYAQMYEDLQFPIDIATAAADHPLLEPDLLQSLYRRLKILNNCANVHQQRVTHTDESEDENYALSNNWTYQADIKRWSRTCKAMESGVDEACRQDSQQSEADEIFPRIVQTPSLRRTGSSKLRRRAVLFSDKDIPNLSDSEVTPRHTRRSRTKSFDKTETWSHHSNIGPSSIWENLAETDNNQEEAAAAASTNLDNTGPSLSSLSCTQLQVLKKLALLTLTTYVEKNCPSHRTGWNFDLPKFFRKKSPMYKDKNVFGVPISVNLQKSGQVLPKNIEEALRWLEQNACDQVGIFRKPGVKSRIQALRNIVESSNDIINFNDHQPYDVADMVKQYFRDLPEALLTTKFSETFILIFQNLPKNIRQEAVLCALLLMPEEHIEVLEILLTFLTKMTQHSAVNQMNESNLATCFAPSLFHYSQQHKQNLGSPHPKELAENKAAHECLLYFLENAHNLFNIPKEFINKCKTAEIFDHSIVQLDKLGKDRGGYREFLNECQQNFIKEVKEKGRGFTVIPSFNPRIEISYKKVADGIPLRLWKVCAEVEAPPAEVLQRILRERHLWDPELHLAKIVNQIDNKTEVFQFVRRRINPLPFEEYCVVRTWRDNLPKESCLVIELSVEHPDAIPVPNTIRGVVFASRYLIEPCGSGKSRIVHLSRVDTKGRSSDWYQKNYGHLCGLLLANIQNSFNQDPTIGGPESKV